ncbi:dephospho-CoA kinase [Enterococcus alishanensis]|uniref:Dephospho-CoA kinase n=1 Tax=Enterococcus alishanensis TaxID=1303817 RepID=A0ABS6TBQ9_9ENTE|nr:dephospho-CoA kinase [Enterococcus alishanensis]MBV7390326.1 dephospho-CoA kinase [Enterococcus alishanensis]
MSFVLGVTGSIATGKSTVVNVFKNHQIPVVDGDVVAREVVEPGTEGLAAVVEKFGEDILLAEGGLDRKKLGDLVFSQPDERLKLNETIKPFIRKEILRQIEELKKKSPLVIADIPLLYEAHYEKELDAVAVVYVSPRIQLERLMKRNNYTENEAFNRINSQWSIDEKKQKADIVFDNRGTIEETKQQVEDWLKKQNFIS